MKARHLWLACVLAGATATAYSTQYTVTLIGTVLPTDTFSAVGGINNRGEVTGRSQSTSTENFVWSSSTGTTQIPGLVGYEPAINDVGQVAGQYVPTYDYGSVAVSGQPVAALWSAADGLTPIGSVNDFIYGSIPNAINNSGAVVGDTQAAATPNHAFYWDATSGFSDLGTLDTRTGGVSSATSINNFNVVVGSTSRTDGALRPFIWSQATGMQEITAIPGWLTSATGINDAGQIVGTFGDTYAGHAFRWSPDGSFIDLGTLPGAGSSLASDINASGAVVGQSYYSGFIWTPEAGMVDLNSLLQGAPEGMQIVQGKSINDLGQIAANAWFQGNNVAVLLTPVPEPSPCLMGVVGLAMFLCVKVRRRSDRISG